MVNSIQTGELASSMSDHAGSFNVSEYWNEQSEVPHISFANFNSSTNSI